MFLECLIDDLWDVDKGKTFIQKRLNGRFVGRVEDSGRGATRSNRLIGEAQAREACEIWRFECERANFREVQGG